MCAGVFIGKSYARLDSPNLSSDTQLLSRSWHVSCSVPARSITTHGWRVISKHLPHCAFEPTNCESPPLQPGQVYRSASNQSASTPPGQPGRASTQGSGTPQTPFCRVFWPPRLLRACVDWRSGETGEGVETPVCLIRFQFTGYLPNREWTAISWSPGRGAGPFRRGRQC